MNVWLGYWGIRYWDGVVMVVELCLLEFVVVDVVICLSVCVSCLGVMYAFHVYVC